MSKSNYAFVDQMIKRHHSVASLYFLFPHIRKPPDISIWGLN